MLQTSWHGHPILSPVYSFPVESVKQWYGVKNTWNSQKMKIKCDHAWKTEPIMHLIQLPLKRLCHCCFALFHVIQYLGILEMWVGVMGSAELHMNKETEQTSSRDSRTEKAPVRFLRRSISSCWDRTISWRVVTLAGNDSVMWTCYCKSAKKDELIAKEAIGDLGFGNAGSLVFWPQRCHTFLGKIEIFHQNTRLSLKPLHSYITVQLVDPTWNITYDINVSGVLLIFIVWFPKKPGFSYHYRIVALLQTDTKNKQTHLSQLALIWSVQHIKFI